MSPRVSIRLLSAQSDQRLAALAGQGHERAFEAIVHRYRRPLLRYCRRMQLADARAEDVLQQAFMQAWMAFARGTEVREVRPWLYRIVHNAAVSVLRGAPDALCELTESTQAAAALAGDSELQRKMAVREALAHVAALPQMQQQAIFLTAVDGQSNDEVAGVLGISQGALRGLLYRARASLRSAAAALTPPPLLEWAARSADTAGPTAERAAELSAGGGAAGIAGLLLKGAIVAVTAGAVATGATVVNSHRRADGATAQRSSAAGLAAATAQRQPAASGVPPVPMYGARSGLSEGSGRARRHAHRRRHDGAGRRSSGRQGEHSSHSGDSAGARSGSGGDKQTHDGGLSFAQDSSTIKGTDSPTGSGSPDGHRGSADSSGGLGDSAGRQSTSDGGGELGSTSDSSSAGNGATSSGQGDGATTPGASDASSGDLSGSGGESGKSDS